MKNLELKHLAPYLPYNISYNYTNIDKISVLTSDVVARREKLGTLDKIKPILRPLSDLAKEIEHISYTKELERNKQMIVPDELFKKHWFITIREDGYFERNNGDGTATGFSYRSAPYDIISILFQWQFDVFGLIDAGLAIDKNTI